MVSVGEITRGVLGTRSNGFELGRLRKSPHQAQIWLQVRDGWADFVVNH